MVESIFAQNVLAKQLRGEFNPFSSYFFYWPLLTAIDIQNNEEISCSVGLENENDLFVWNVVFEGPADTLYEVSFHFLSILVNLIF